MKDYKELRDELLHAQEMIDSIIYSCRELASDLDECKDDEERECVRDRFVELQLFLVSWQKEKSRVLYELDRIINVDKIR